MEEMTDIKDEEIDDIFENFKKEIECICPKCGRKHRMNLRWIGRGTPRKFCGNCRNSDPLDI